MTRPDVRISPDIAALHRAAAEHIVALATERIAATGRFLVVLAGGSTPRGLYELLAREPYRSQIRWEHVHVLWSDERYVAADHPDSNQLVARTALLDHVPIPAAQIATLRTTDPDPQTAAIRYNDQIRLLLHDNGGQFDLTLLGMGPDGHTASLFPHTMPLHTEDDPFAVLVRDAPKPPPLRISLTYRALNSSMHVLFLVSGSDKAAMLNTVLHDERDTQTYPAQRVCPPHGHVVWMIDQAASTALPSHERPS